MRRASSPSLLLSNLIKSTFFSRNLVPHLFSHIDQQSPSPISPPRLIPCSKPRGAPRNPRPAPFPKCPPCRTVHTLSHHPELEGEFDPGETLESAATAEGVLAAFEALESSVAADDPRLGLACLKVAQHMDSIGSDDLEKALNFAVRALQILERSDGAGSLSVVKALRLLGSVSCKLGMFDDSLESLRTAEEILGRLEQDCSFQSDVLATGAAVQAQLASTKAAMGRWRDALLNLQRSLELKEAFLEPNCLELSAAYKELAEAHITVLEFKEALPLCLKAVEIHERQLMESSLEVAQIRRLIAVVFTGLGENEEALKQNKLAQMILQCEGSEDELLHVEIEAANIQIALGRLEEAINILKGVIQQMGKEGEARAFAFISMAKALCDQEKFGDSRRCLEIACSILNKMESVSPAKVAEAYAEASMLYEMINEFDIALSLMKRTLTMLEKLPQERHLEGSISARIGWLLLLTGRVPQAVPYLESAIERLKESFGPKHFGIGFVYKHLGQSYIEMDKPQLALQMLANAKDIICTLFGPHHVDSIDTYQCLANAYGAMGSYALAVEFQQRVVDAWESHGSSASDEFREAHRLLEQLKRKSQGSPAAVFPANALPLPPQK